MVTAQKIISNEVKQKMPGILDKNYFVINWRISYATNLTGQRRSVSGRILKIIVVKIDESTGTKEIAAFYVKFRRIKLKIYRHCKLLTFCR